MHIEEVIIDGFKSYRHRTVISGFHTHFNAITGLNGSGKSNILDAICFVLGITNLKHVRAQNLQDLVYKKGHAGVTKASVTIMFNNKDKSFSPAGYEENDQITVTRQIQMGGSNKYLINGRNADKKRVNALFLSVQLNVNNPHFLIMQGRVTKVLSMKPQEILSLIEEAAGTKIFETSKNTSYSLIEKKDKKLKEIDSILDEEVEPKMQQLKKERSAYLQFQKNQQEIDMRSRYVLAYQFYTKKATLDAVTAEYTKSEENIRCFNNHREELRLALADVEQNLDILRKKKEAEMGGALRDIEKEVQSISKELVTETAGTANAAETLASETAAAAQVDEGEKEIIASINAKKMELQNTLEALGPIEQTHKDCTIALEKAQRDLQAVRAGMSTGENDSSSSFDDMLRLAENTMAGAKSEKQQLEMQLKHAKAELKEKKPQAAQAELSHGTATQQVKQKKLQLEQLKAQLDSTSFDTAEADRLQTERNEMARRVRQLQNLVDGLQADNRGFTFDYADPERNFDRKRVHGLVARLLQILDSKYTNALEVAAGGRLYNVVIDTQDTGSKLLKNGKLRHRVTFIPLNKIAARTISERAMHKAQSIVGKENAHLALTLVGYPEEVERAMQFVFGATIVCSDANAAQRITYDKDIMTRCVTLDGDVYEPSGTLSGGSSKNRNSMLQRLQNLNEATENLRQGTQALAAIDIKVSNVMEEKRKYNELASAYKNCKYQFELLDKTIRSSPHGALIQEVVDLETTISDYTARIHETMAIVKASVQRIKEIDQEKKEFVNSRDSQTEKMEKLLAKQKKANTQALQRFKDQKQKIDGLESELKEYIDDLSGVDAQKTVAANAVRKANEKLRACEKKLELVQRNYDSANERLQKKRDKLGETDSEIKKATILRSQAAKEMEDIVVEHKKATHKQTRMKAECMEHKDGVAKMLREHAWMKNEAPHFGKAGSSYDFQNKEDPRESAKELNRLNRQQETLKGEVNMEAMRMLDELSAEHKDLVKKRDIVEVDKKKIILSIEDIEKKKNEQMKTTIAKVNTDFGSIFSILLPGTTAKLAPPEGQSVLEGLEVKVAFGSTWKESLTELSGGQRSLIALSLILALLLFKPAPMYILDEIDAALDLSHTQNIGNMLRTHFSQSQFIVVSLKEGMFDNANCLFRVRFVDGSSAVTRYVQDPSANKSGGRTTPTSKENASMKKLQQAAAKVNKTVSPAQVLSSRNV
eukprot:CFRG0493T1